MPRRDANDSSSAATTTSSAPSEHALSGLQIDGEPLSIGMINPGLQKPIKAAAYVDLLLAPTGAAAMYGEPSAILAALDRDSNLKFCGSDATEVIAASAGLMQLMGEGEDGLAAVRAALCQRPEALSVIAAFLAYTPFIGGEESTPPAERAAFDVANLSFKDPEACQSPPKLTPEQTSVASGKATLGVTAVLLCAVGGGRSMRSLVRRHFVGSRHFRACMLRLVALVGRYNPVGMATANADEADKARVSHQLAMVARDALCALCMHHRPCLDLIDEPAMHPFMKNGVTARSLIAAIRMQGSPLQMPREGARHPDDPFLARDYIQIGALIGGLLLGIRFVVWPVLQFVCMYVLSIPGSALRWLMGPAVG